MTHKLVSILKDFPVDDAETEKKIKDHKKILDAEDFPLWHLGDKKLATLKKQWNARAAGDASTGTDDETGSKATADTEGATGTGAAFDNLVSIETQDTITTVNARKRQVNFFSLL